MLGSYHECKHRLCQIIRLIYSHLLFGLLVWVQFKRQSGKMNGIIIWVWRPGRLPAATKVNIRFATNLSFRKTVRPPPTTPPSQSNKWHTNIPFLLQPWQLILNNSPWKLCWLGLFPLKADAVCKSLFTPSRNEPGTPAQQHSASCDTRCWLPSPEPGLTVFPSNLQADNLLCRLIYCLSGTVGEQKLTIKTTTKKKLTL